MDDLNSRVEYIEGKKWSVWDIWLDIRDRNPVKKKMKIRWRGKWHFSISNLRYIWEGFLIYSLRYGPNVEIINALKYDYVSMFHETSIFWERRTDRLRIIGTIINYILIGSLRLSSRNANDGIQSVRRILLRIKNSCGILEVSWQTTSMVSFLFKIM